MTKLDNESLDNILQAAAYADTKKELTSATLEKLAKVSDMPLNEIQEKLAAYTKEVDDSPGAGGFRA